MQAFSSSCFDPLPVNSNQIFPVWFLLLLEVLCISTSCWKLVWCCAQTAVVVPLRGGAATFHQWLDRGIIQCVAWKSPLNKCRAVSLVISLWIMTPCLWEIHAQLDPVAESRITLQDMIWWLTQTLETTPGTACGSCCTQKIRLEGTFFLHLLSYILGQRECLLAWTCRHTQFLFPPHRNHNN